MATIESIKLYNQEGGSSKEYNVTLEDTPAGHVVNFSYGPIGNIRGTGTKTKTPLSLDDAKKIYNKIVNAQIADGYKPVDSSGVVTVVTATFDPKVTTGLYPMLLTPITTDEAEQYLKHDDWMLQEKFDGVRMMVKATPNQVTASNRKGQQIGVPSDMEQDLLHLAQTCGGMVVDGERIGGVFYVFDLLEHGGVFDLRNSTAETRYHTLHSLFKGLKQKLPTLSLSHTAWEEKQKRDMYQSLLHKEGVIFKHKAGPYVPGKSHTHQFKCKFWSSATCEVLRVNAKSSVALGVLDGTKKVFVGNATLSIGHDNPQAGDLVEIKYLYFVNNLVQPIYLNKRDDIAEADQLSTLKQKSNNDEDYGRLHPL